MLDNRFYVKFMQLEIGLLARTSLKLVTFWLNFIELLDELYRVSHVSKNLLESGAHKSLFWTHLLGL